VKTFATRGFRLVFIAIPQESGSLKRCIVGTKHALSLKLAPYITVTPAESLGIAPTGSRWEGRVRWCEHQVTDSGIVAAMQLGVLTDGGTEAAQSCVSTGIKSTSRRRTSASEHRTKHYRLIPPNPHILKPAQMPMILQPQVPWFVLGISRVIGKLAFGEAFLPVVGVEVVFDDQVTI
jgi:hypothetical protein